MSTADSTPRSHPSDNNIINPRSHPPPFNLRAWIHEQAQLQNETETWSKPMYDKEAQVTIRDA